VCHDNERAVISAQGLVNKALDSHAAVSLETHNVDR